MQVSLGKIPYAILNAQRAKTGIRIHSGMASDGIIALADPGVLERTWQHVATTVLGSPALYDWIRDRGDFHVRGADYTHDAGQLSRFDGFVAVKSAIEADLFGQCNLQSAFGRAISGPGGASDFAHAARLSRGGLSIIALPAAFGGGKGSRIRAVFEQGHLASLPRTKIDLVVTEHGAADLRGRSVHERAIALVELAAPPFREALREQWHSLAARM